MKWQGIEEDYIARSLMFFTPQQLSSGGSNKKNEMGWACGTYGTQNRGVKNFFGEGGDLREETTCKT